MMDTETKKIVIEGNEEGKFDFLYQLAYEMFADEKKKPLLDIYLNLEFFQNLSPNDILMLKRKDRTKKYVTSYMRLVHVACFCNKPTEFIIYLLEQGFSGSQDDIDYIITNQNFDLLRYYREKDVLRGGRGNSHCLSRAILANRIDILQYLIEHDFSDMSVRNKWTQNSNWTVYRGLKACFETRNTDALWVIFQHFPADTKQCIKWVMEDFKGERPPEFMKWIEEKITKPNPRTPEELRQARLKFFDAQTLKVKV